MKQDMLDVLFTACWVSLAGAGAFIVGCGVGYILNPSLPFLI